MLCLNCRFRKDGVAIYEEAVRAMKRQETTTIYVDFEHLSDFNAELSQVCVCVCVCVCGRAARTFALVAVNLGGLIGVFSHSSLSLRLCISQRVQEMYYRLLPFLREALRAFVLSLDSEYGTDDKDQPREFHVGFFNADDHKRIRDLNTATIGTLVSIRGTVRQAALSPHVSCPDHHHHQQPTRPPSSHQPIIIIAAHHRAHHHSLTH
jgi:hypothetical protein